MRLPLTPSPARRYSPAPFRLTGCPYGAADGLNSLAAVHPELLAEWDAAPNAPLRPERIKATYDNTVVWRCPDDPTHPSYRMSPYARGKVEIGCKICRKARRSAAARRPAPAAA